MQTSHKEWLGLFVRACRETPRAMIEPFIHLGYAAIRSLKLNEQSSTVTVRVTKGNTRR
jgi:hypothetical protein